MTSIIQKEKTTDLSQEIIRLQEGAKKHLENSKAENTKRAYQSDWQQFASWCKKHKLQALPASPETVSYYITYLGGLYKASSIKRKMVVISQRHETAGFQNPVKSSLVKGVWTGVQRKIGIREEGKEPTWLQDLSVEW